MASAIMQQYCLALRGLGYTKVTDKWNTATYKATDALRVKYSLPRSSKIDCWIIALLEENDLLTRPNGWNDIVQLITESGGNTPDVEWWKIQAFLIDLGIYKHSWDGRVGPRTRDGIKKFQDNNGLPSTGYIDNYTGQLMLLSLDPNGYSRSINQIKMDNGTYLNLEDVAAGANAELEEEVHAPTYFVPAQKEPKGEEELEVIEMEPLEVIGEVHPLAGWITPLFIIGGIGLFAIGTFFMGRGGRSEAAKRLARGW